MITVDAGTLAPNESFNIDVAVDVASGAFKITAAGRERIGGRKMGTEGPLTIVASRSHGGERLEGYLAALGGEFGEVSRTPVGSSLKLCILAEGNADLYPRLGPTSEWDTAASHCILEEAGGRVLNCSGEPLSYNKEDVLNPWFIALGGGDYDWLSLCSDIEKSEAHG